MRVAVFTTSYPRNEEDFAGRFVADAIRELEARGVDVELVGPGSYRDFGLTAGTGAGFVGNLRRRPWLAPLVFLTMAVALRRAARKADLVHVHWLLGALLGVLTGRPFVVTLHGTGTAGLFSDLELAARWPRLVRLLLKPARAVICVSDKLEQAMKDCGLTNAVYIPNGVVVPSTIESPLDPPHILYAGRLSPEKNIDVLAEATVALPLVVAGDGPLRNLLPQAQGFLPHRELEKLYDDAAIVTLVSSKEGLPIVVLEAMAHGRPVVATPVGGVPALIVDGVTGFLVPMRDSRALRDVLERLLADGELRLRVGRAAQAEVRRTCSWDVVTDRTLAVYRDALAPNGNAASAA